MITKEAYVIGAAYCDFFMYVDGWKIKCLFYLNTDNDGLGLLPIRRIK